MTVIDRILLAIALYAGLGTLFALAFVINGVTRIDPAARGTTVSFRCMIFPGSAALWPLLAVKWLRLSRSQP